MEALKLADLLTWVLILEFRQVVNVLIDDDVQIIWLVVRCDIARSKRLDHRPSVVISSTLYCNSISLRLSWYNGSISARQSSRKENQDQVLGSDVVCGSRSGFKRTGKMARYSAFHMSSAPSLVMLHSGTQQAPRFLSKLP